MKNAATQTPCTKAQAKTLTKRIREGVEEVWSLLTEAHNRKAWSALGYPTWKAYVEAEFGMTKQRSYQLLDQGRVIASIREAAGLESTVVDLSERETRYLKDDLPAVTAHIRGRVGAGEKPQKAAADVIAAKRAERAAQQAENDAHQEQARAALPDSIKRAEEAKARNGSTQAAVAGKSKLITGIEEAVVAEREELRDEVAALKTDLAERNQRLALFDGMAVQWEKGGFEAVIATKDEQIRVLRRQVEDESADKATWARRAEFWKKQAFALGYVSPNSQIDGDVGDAGQASDYADLAPF